MNPTPTSLYFLLQHSFNGNRKHNVCKGGRYNNPICVHPPFAPFKRDYNPLLHPYKSKGGCTPPLNFIITFFMSHTHLKITLLILGLEGCKNFLVSFVHPSGENLCTPLMPDERKLFSPP